MTIAPLTCPFCNARVEVQPGTAVGQKVTCPNCNEPFTLKHSPEELGIQPPPAVTPAAPRVPSSALLSADVPGRAAKPVGANRLVGLAVLGVMVVMAGVGLGYALLTQKDRRAHDTGISRPSRRLPLPDLPVVEPEESAPPARLAALGYLPPDLGVLAGLDVRELRGSAAGKELLRQPFQVGDREFPLDRVVNWTGLKLEDVDHAVLGVQPDAPLKTTFLVVRTRTAYDGADLKKSLHARDASVGKRRLDRVEVPGLALKPLLYCPDDRTLVLGLSDRELERVPATPVAGLGHLNDTVRSLLEQRVGTGGPLWVVGASANWEETAAGLLFQRFEQAQRERLRGVRAFALWLEPGKPVGPADPIPVTVRAAVRCAGEEAARTVDEQVLRPWLSPEKADGGTKVVRDGEWLTVQVKTDLAVIRRAFAK